MNGVLPILEDLERDALAELVNIGVSRAAVSLRKMVGAEILLSVPSLEVVSRTTAATLMVEREPGPLVAVRQSFAGTFAGQALLIFPEENSLELVRAVVGEMMSLAEILEMAQEALAETANIVLSNCLSMMANMLEHPLTLSLPEILIGENVNLIEIVADQGPSTVVLFLYVNFDIDDRNVRGYIAMLMDLPSIDVLRAQVRDFIARATGEC